MNTNYKTIIKILAAAAVVGGIYYLVTRAPGAPSDMSANQPGVPVVKTQQAAFISQSTALLNGEVNQSGGQTARWAELLPYLPPGRELIIFRPPRRLPIWSRTRPTITG